MASVLEVYYYNNSNLRSIIKTLKLVDKIHLFMTLCLINSDTNRQYFNVINNIYLQPKAQIILNSETEEATVGMSSTT